MCPSDGARECIFFVYACVVMPMESGNLILNFDLIEDAHPINVTKFQTAFYRLLLSCLHSSQFGIVHL